MYALCPRRNAGTDEDGRDEGGMRIKKDHTNCHPIKSIHDFLSPSRSEEQWAGGQAGGRTGSLGDNQSEVAAAAGTVEDSEYGQN